MRSLRVLLVALIACAITSPASAAETRTGPYDFAQYCTATTSSIPSLGLPDGVPQAPDTECRTYSSTDTTASVLTDRRAGHLFLTNAQQCTAPGVPCIWHGIWRSSTGIYFQPDATRSTSVLVSLNGVQVQEASGTEVVVDAGTQSITAGNNFITREVPSTGASTLQVTVPPLQPDPANPLSVTVTLQNRGSAWTTSGPVQVDVTAIALG